MHRVRRDQRGQSLVIVLSLITLFFLLGSALAVHASVALRATRTSAGQGDDFYAADAATELGIWWQRNGRAGNPPSQTINGITTSTTITTAGGGGGGSCPATPPTVAWMSGMEAGTFFATNSPTVGSMLGGGFNAYITGTGAFVDVVTSPVRTGSYALRVHPTSTISGTYAEVVWPWNVPLGDPTVVHFAIRFDTLPSTDATVFEIRRGGMSTYPGAYFWYRASTGKWSVSLTNGQSLTQLYQEGSVTAVAGQWHTFDVRFNSGASTPTAKAVDWYVDNVAQPMLSVVEGPWTPSSGGPNVQFGSDGVNSIYTAYYDDIMISTTAGDFPIGDINIDTLLPNSNTTHASFQGDNSLALVANSSYLRVDDKPLNGILDFIKQTVTGATAYVELGLADTAQTCIRGASAVEAIHNVSGTAGNALKTSIFDGATETVLYSGTIGAATLKHAQRPITPGGTWTMSRLNGLVARIGYGSDVNPVPAWDGVFVEYAWRNLAGGAPATVTIVGTGGGSTVSAGYPDAGAGVPTLSTWTTTK
jgi:hypothetical protein